MSNLILKRVEGVLRLLSIEGSKPENYLNTEKIEELLGRTSSVQHFRMHFSFQLVKEELDILELVSYAHWCRERQKIVVPKDFQTSFDLGLKSGYQECEEIVNYEINQLQKQAQIAETVKNLRKVDMNKYKL